MAGFEFGCALLTVIPQHLGIAQTPAWLFASELKEGTVLRLLTPFERTVPILAVRPASRLSTKVRIFIEHLDRTFALCPQFNPPRQTADRPQ
jgi:LysR family transcriptional regulator for bpeEF and oprC